MAPTAAFTPLPPATRIPSPTSTPAPSPVPPPTSAAVPRLGEIPSPFQKFSPLLSVTIDGDYLIIRTTGVPDHPSPYFPRSDSRYEPYNGRNVYFRQNPNRIAAQSLVLRLPLHPQKSDHLVSTPLGPIGVAINGVPFFNQYAGPNRPLTQEVDSFDQHNGHPQMTGMYHYHVEPTSLTSRYGRDSLVGFLLDGFPVYGSEEGGQTLRSADLDEFHGHWHKTTEYPEGIYHYHITADAPYINGIGFYGGTAR
ncbi:MAG: YHYH protein [Chloroflexi bacterium]|nr:YHYH protein [Chloroflexota bacterium]